MQKSKVSKINFLPGSVKGDKPERLYHIDDTPTGVSDVFREGDKLYEVGIQTYCNCSQIY